jgi:hypothetical protein
MNSTWFRSTPHALKVWVAWFLSLALRVNTKSTSSRASSTTRLLGIPSGQAMSVPNAGSHSATMRTGGTGCAAA